MAQNPKTGDEITFITTGVVRGERVLTTRGGVFAHSHPSEEEFIPAAEGRPAQSRIFLLTPAGAVPVLAVKGTVKRNHRQKS